MSKSQNLEKPPTRAGRKVFVPLALAVSAAGFAAGMMGGPFVLSRGGSTAEKVVQVEVGPFPLAMPGFEMQFVLASVSIHPEAAPAGQGQLHDAVHVLLTEASGFPLVLDGRTALTELEEVVMSMAPVSAPWLVAVDLEPADGKATAALSPAPVPQAAG